MNTDIEDEQMSGEIIDDRIALTISVPSTFWVFRIAEAVRNHGGSVEVYTSEPAFLRNADESAASVETIHYPFLIKQVGYQFPWLNRVFTFSGFNRPFKRYGDYLFDRAVSRRLHDGTGLFLGFAGACRDSVQRANELGHVTAVERSSTHIRTQQRILQEEYRRYSIDGQPVSAAHVEREEQEYATADYIVTPSEFTVQTFIEHGVDPDKLIQIPFGANVDVEPTTHHGESFTALYAGQVSLRKGIQYLLPAWNDLSLPDAELFVAGNVTDSATELVAEYRNNDSIHFLGWVDDMEELYQKASVFVLPTLEEGSARVTYEAMARSIPIVTSPHSGWVGRDSEHGIEVPIRDKNALADAILRMFTDDEFRQACGVAGRTLIASEYTWEHYEERVWEAYREMAGY